MQADFGFHFSQSTLGLTQGGNDSRREHFRQQGPVPSLVRELGQNSLDAKAVDADGPVRMVFELKECPVEATYGLDFKNLSSHIRAAHKAIESLGQPNKEYDKAVKTLNRKSIPVLRVSDYNTTGLTGDESDNNSPLSALTRTSGVSAKPMGKGGSYGIGAAAGTFNSRIFTTFWTTLTANQPEFLTVAGRVDIASHEINSVDYDATGFFVDRNSLKRFSYMRSKEALFGFQRRTTPGTDTYIPAYVGADNDPELSQIKDAFVENFFAAIRAGDLEVEGISEHSGWVLNRETLAEEIDQYSEIKPFYDALSEDPQIGEIEALGEVKLFVNLDPDLTKRHHTILMRKPLMKVTEYPPKNMPKYAAVFLCSNDHGNELLRSLEPPAHNDWVRNDPDFPQGKTIVRDIRAFIRETIRDLASVKNGEEITLKGLKELLPSGLGNPLLDELSTSETPSTNEEDGLEESSTSHGDSSPIPTKEREAITIRPHLRQAGASPGDQDALSGNRSRKKTTKRSSGGSRRTAGASGEGNASIATELKDLLIWFNPSAKELKIWLKASRDVKGDLTLCAVSDSGLEESFDLGILEAVQESTESKTAVEVSGNTLKDLSFEHSQEKLLLVKLIQPRRLRIGVI